MRYSGRGDDGSYGVAYSRVWIHKHAAHSSRYSLIWACLSIHTVTQDQKLKAEEAEWLASECQQCNNKQSDLATISLFVFWWFVGQRGLGS